VHILEQITLDGSSYFNILGLVSFFYKMEENKYT
jgi:hypothetical protein